MGEDRFEVVAAKTGFADEGFGTGNVLVPSSAIANGVVGVVGGSIANSTAGKSSIGVEMKLLIGKFVLYGLPNVDLEVTGDSIEISAWNGELGPSSQVISSSSVVGMFALPSGGESSKE